MPWASQTRTESAFYPLPLLWELCRPRGLGQAWPPVPRFPHLGGRDSNRAYLQLGGAGAVRIQPGEVQSSDQSRENELLGWKCCLLAVWPWASDIMSLSLVSKAGLTMRLAPGGFPP